MSIIQISRVQVRRGQTSQTGFPQLASGEFGWSVDQQELYIGNGAVSEGAPAIGNTRLITEHDSNFFLIGSPSYTYKNTPNGPAVQTGPNDSPYVLRLVQDKLDDTVNLRDFGALGDGVTDDTAAIQRAVTYVSQNKKVLNLNEGVFLISSSISIPPFAELRGAGINKTVLTVNTATSIFNTVGFDANNMLTSVDTAIQTPRDITITGISFVSSSTGAPAMLNLLGVINSNIDNCEFKADPSMASTGSMANAIGLSAVGAITCDHVNIRNCFFRNLGTAIKSDYDITNISIYGNNFSHLDSGVIFYKTPVGGQGSLFGPSYVDIENNEFDNINNQGLFVGSNAIGTSFIHSSNNIYNNVGIGYNNPLGELHQSTEVITFNTFANETTNDVFNRSLILNSQPLSNFVGLIKPTVVGPSILQDVNSIGSILIASNTSKSVYSLARSSYYVTNIRYSTQYIKLNYTITRSGNLVRQGVFDMTVNNSINDLLMDDDFTCSGNTDGDVVFYVDLTRSDVLVVNATNTGADCTITYSVYVRQ